ncbi:MAG TPA: SPOR domain-containing protein [Casimicrobiaceae bacterium]|nr:SPOR domain-containing protein [Casimicrobiaceae bacterium]
MRIVVLLLLVANLTLLGYTLLDSGGGEGVRFSQQVQPEKIKLLSPQEVAALGPAKVAALADVCVEFGPLSELERAKVMTELEPLALGRLLTQRRVDVDNAFIVSVSPFPSRVAADNRASELRRQGVKDMSVIDIGRGQFAVSFGAFRTEQAATSHADELAKLGVKLVRVQPRQQPVAQTMIVVRDPQQSAVVRLKELQATYPGTEVKVGACVASG